MIHIFLALLLLTSCHPVEPNRPKYNHESKQIPLRVGSVNVTISPAAQSADSMGIFSALKDWSKKRFMLSGRGMLTVHVDVEKTPMQSDSMNFWNNHAIVLTLTLSGSDLYKAVSLKIKTHRTMGAFPHHPPTVGTPAWSEFIGNLINSIDAQILHGLRRYGPKLLMKS